MKVKKFLSSSLIVTLIALTGCSNKINQERNEEIDVDNTVVVNSDLVTNENSPINKDNTEVSMQDNTISSDNDFTLDDIKEFLLYADTLVDIIINGSTTSDKVIGRYDNADVVKINGEYDTFVKVKKLMGDYYTDKVIEMELNRRYLVNLYGKIGEICASGENFYYISEETNINLKVDEDNKKVIEVDVFNDNEDISIVEYTFEKQSSGSWIITDENGY